MGVSIGVSEYVGSRCVDYVEDWTPGVSRNVVDLLSRVNGLLLDLVEIGGLELEVGLEVLSGWEPGDWSTGWHVIGRGVDLSDVSGALGACIIRHYELLDVHGLWMEHPVETPGRVHLDTGSRGESMIRIFASRGL